jgi:3-oxoacyl-[acyl-carrier-protein] synthase-1
MDLEIVSHCRITDKALSLNGNIIPVVYSEERKTSRLDAIYRTLGIEYPKFFKMDNLCKAGFLAAELVCNHVHWDRDRCNRDAAIVCFNSSSSLDDDTIYQKTICDKENYYPSPSVFVYTLANIVAGEIAIRNKIMGETAFYITENFSAQQMCDAITDVFNDHSVDKLLCSWTEYYHNHCDVLMMYIKRSIHALDKLTPQYIADLYDMS